MTTLLVGHVLISLSGIFSGFLVASSFLLGRRHEHWMSFFLATTVMTSVTGFMFPADHVSPGHVFGVLSLISLSIAVATRNSERHMGAWSRTHIASVLFAFYLNAFVLVVQLFQKVPALTALAPTQSELPFAVAQLLLLSAFIAAGYLSFRHNRALQVRGINHVLRLVTS
jgi:hypothetical protein